MMEHSISLRSLHLHESMQMPGWYVPKMSVPHFFRAAGVSLLNHCKFLHLSY